MKASEFRKLIREEISKVLEYYGDDRREANEKKVRSFKLSNLQKVVKYITTPNVVEGLPKGKTISGLTEKDFEPIIQYAAVLQKTLIDNRTGEEARRFVNKFNPSDLALPLSNLKRIKPIDANVAKWLKELETDLDSVSSWLDSYNSIVPGQASTYPNKKQVERDRWTGDVIRTYYAPDRDDDWTGYDMTSRAASSDRYPAVYRELVTSLGEVFIDVENLIKTQDVKTFK